jgi:hypothetical protein
MNAAGGAGLTTIYQAADVKPHDFDTDHPRVTYVKDGVSHEIACDFIAGCDGFTASAAPACRERDPDLRADLSVRLARHPVGDAAGQPRIDLYQPRKRFRALHHALDAPQPLLRAMSARRSHRSMAGRTILG